MCLAERSEVYLDDGRKLTYVLEQKSVTGSRQPPAPGSFHH